MLKYAEINILDIAVKHLDITIEPTFCQKSIGNWSIKHKLFIIHPNLFYRLQSWLLPK